MYLFCHPSALSNIPWLDRNDRLSDNTDKKRLFGKGMVIEMIYPIKEGKEAAALFAGWEESLIWSCLQGMMGRLYGDAPVKPESAMAFLGDFMLFSGKENRELAAFWPDGCVKDFLIAVPQTRRWADLLEECHDGRIRKVTRYAMKKEPDVFDKGRLQEIVAGLSAEYTICLIDEKLYGECRKEDWCRDFTAQFSDWETYRQQGLGVMILKDGMPVAGASSYSAFGPWDIGGRGEKRGGIEIEIDTREEYRRRGLAFVCGARLILECLDRGLYPSWDAQNLWSVSLAEKLGYHFDYEYTAYEIRR